MSDQNHEKMLQERILGFSQTCCENPIDTQDGLFKLLLRKFRDAWDYFQSPKSSEKNDPEFVQSCLRDLLLAQTVSSDSKAFELVDQENTPSLMPLVKKWRFRHVAGDKAEPKEVVYEFYSDMIAKGKWDVFKGYAKLAGWLSVYLRAFLRDSLNQGMRNSDEDSTSQTSIESNEKEKKKRDRRFVSFADGLEFEHNDDPQKRLALNTLKNLVRDCFSKLSPEDLQFLTALRANIGEGITQKELAEQLNIADYNLTRIKKSIHKRFSELLNQEIQKIFPNTQFDLLRSEISLDDLLVLLKE